ncbi:metallophosphoesterase [Campylobacter helveticus]|uniref:Metallophosphoesterase n=1 Tax=Campylobacter helveticus TaxID=28898 RepID=A0AAX2UJV6_9BACT|nr:metallophosphoesterase [Campylobacter helveticus]ARE80503.1 metallophosphatase [Campylobacter helveticus]MCR2055348.1 metallophosphoesterase [Campylobacter helveticus]TNB57138.1 metallophosphoesterase [Campylobacter helveticus]TNB59350.1 metallophosphoesterase [Campylobacter helveticus]TNH32554.1 metallophosphoesterase [Campylobacter helveticus]
MLFLVFSFGVALIFGLANIYIYKRLVLKFITLKYLRKLFAFVLFMLFFAQAFFMVFRSSEYLNDVWYSFFASLYAPTYCFFFITLILDFLRFVLAMLGKTFMKIASFVKVAFEIFVLALGAFLTYFSIYSAIKVPEFSEVDIIIPHLEKELKIAMLTDIHLGKNLHENFLSDIIEKVSSKNVDMVVIVGDLVDTNPNDLKPYISKLNDLKSSYGTFYALGNHEYYHGINEVLELLKTQTNMKILVNDAIDLGFANIAGVGDLAGLRKGILAPDLARAKVDLNLSKPSILLAHQPKTALLYDVSDFDLILSGHTHGGQVFPFALLVKLQQGFVSGLYVLSEKTQLFVSRGAGFWGPSLRTFSQSELVILNLKGRK